MLLQQWQPQLDSRQQGGRAVDMKDTEGMSELTELN